MPHKNATLALSAYLQDLTQTDEIALADEPERAHELAIATQLLEHANSMLIAQNEGDLAQAAPVAQSNAEIDANLAINTIVDKENISSVETVCTAMQLDLRPLRTKLSNRFQALFFEVGGLTLAIPLVELGGIIKMQALNKLPGKPSWFMGVMVKQQERYQCVDTAQWIMPEKATEALSIALQYSHLIQLGKTPWGLACTQLITTHELSHEDINWRSQGAKRPWLAGMIKQKMCALIDPSQLIGLLESKPSPNASSVVTE
jgi:purine-binding chemotaxis protein CheW